MQVVILKLVTGEEVIGRLEEGIRFQLDRPRVFQMYQTQSGVQAGLVPWLLSAPEEKVFIDEKHIIARLDAPTDIEQAYLQQTSGLQIAQSLMG